VSFLTSLSMELLRTDGHVTPGLRELHNSAIV
jgi:hypothetical protein